MNKVLKYKNQIFLLLIVLLALRVFIPQIDGLKDGLETLKNADKTWVIAAIIVYFAGVPVLTVQFMSLAVKKLYFKLTLQVEMATLFVNKILPNGVGTISLNMYYLLKKDHTASQATALLTVNSMTSLTAYTFLIIVALTQSSLSLDGLAEAANIPLNLIFFIIILLIGAGYVLYKSDSLHEKIKSMWTGLKNDVKTYRHRPRAICTAIICNGLGSTSSIFALYASGAALGIPITFSEALLAYTFGNIASALIPTPGGIGSAEAGIYSGLVLTGLAGPDAILVTLLYRLITYWIPTPPGYYFFWRLRKTLMSDYSAKKKII